MTIQSSSSKGKQGVGGKAASLTPNKITMVEVSSIDDGERLRGIDDERVSALSERIDAEGHQSPICVSAPDEKGNHRLVYGAYRLQAIRLLGHPKIKAIIAPASASDYELRLLEITENVARFELSILERAVFIAEWRSIWEATNGKIKRGGDRKSKSGDRTLISVDQMEAAGEKFSGSFSENAIVAFALGRTEIFNALKIACIGQKARSLIAFHAIANSTQNLLLLAQQRDEKRQTEIARLLKDGHALTVPEAIAQIDKAPPPAKATAMEKVSKSFSKLSPTEQERFLELHEAAIENWFLKRKSK